MKKIFVVSFCFSLFFAPTIMAQEFGDALCPKPDISSKDTPNDLAAVQSDIERFALCLKRAELLKSLNKISLENTDSLVGASGVAGLGASGDLSDLPPIPGGILDGADEDLDAELDSVADIESPKGTPWLIRDIYGISDNLRAQIESREGDIANVRRGDVLPDGLRVAQITQTGIVLKGDDDIVLQWAQ